MNTLQSPALEIKKMEGFDKAAEVPSIRKAPSVRKAPGCIKDIKK